jgi:nicotinic acid mononucleotide adenylyltransferase
MSVDEASSPGRWRASITEVAADSEPAARVLTPLGTPRSLAVLPGAYNPPTRAHLTLAESARARGFEAVLFSLGTVTLDKPESGLPLEERVQLLVEIARESGFGVVLVNRGLYAEQAEALRRSLHDVQRLAFVIGMDKVSQIFDSRYYADRDRALDALFERAELLVAARGDLDHAALELLLADPPARAFAHRIEWLDLDPRVREVSSSAVRERLARGEPASEWLPAAVDRYLRQRAEVFRKGRG